MKVVGTVSAMLLVNAAMAQPPVIDGNGAGEYGPPIWVQDQPTGFGNNLPGAATPLGNPEDVKHGVEFAIPLSALGNPALSNIKVCAFINGAWHDYVSNQTIGSLPSNQQNLAEPRNVNFNNYTGDQFVTLNPDLFGNNPGSPVPAPAVDGFAEGLYGAFKALQANYTQFGDNGDCNGVWANGSEIDAAYAVVYGNNTATTDDDVLYLVFAGNLQANSNKLEIFFDTQAGGQNRLLAGQCDVDYSGLARMADSGSGNGLRFDSAFEADYWIGATCNDGGSGGATYNVAANYAAIGGGGAFLGLGVPTFPPEQFFCPIDTPVPINGGGTLYDGLQATPPLSGDIPTVLCAIDNRNTQGVTGLQTNTLIPHPDLAIGSEIDALFAKVENGALHLLVTGNLETGYQALNLFFDCDSLGLQDGQNLLLSNNVIIPWDPPGVLNRMGESYPFAGDGLRFDVGFTADYFVKVTNGSNPVEAYADAAMLRGGALFDGFGFVLDYHAYDGGLKTGANANPMDFSGPRRDLNIQDGFPIRSNYGPRRIQPWSGTAVPPAGDGPFDLQLQAAIDNSNVAGVTGMEGSTSIVGADSVMTGIEVRIDLRELGWDGQSPIRVAGFINSKGNDYMSNQVIGGIPGYIEGDPFSVYPNLGEPRFVDFSLIAGQQYVTIPIPPTPDFCPIDLDNDGDYSNGPVPDGVVDINDLLYFLDGFQSGGPNVDLDDDGDAVIGNRDGVSDINDLLFFLARFEIGC